MGRTTTNAEKVDVAPVRVAIVDDSRSVRRWLRAVLDADPRLSVVAEAADGREARDMLRRTQVDILTLDVDMPGMSGIEFLSRLMAHRPMPVVMVSALTEQGSREAVSALSLGAVDCIEKPRSALSEALTQDIRDRVWQAAQTNVVPGALATLPEGLPCALNTGTPWHGPIMLLGASTGGVAALEKVLSEVDDTPWPIVIAQHMPESYLRSFARRLSERLSRRFVLAQDGLVLEEGSAVFANGRSFSTRLIKTSSGQVKCVMGPPSPGSRYFPSISDLFHSAASAGLTGCAALLTGMGADGADGLAELKAVGFTTWAQDETSCVVFGMPRAAIELGAANFVDDPISIGKAMDREMARRLAAEPGEGD